MSDSLSLVTRLTIYYIFGCIMEDLEEILRLFSDREINYKMSETKTRYRVLFNPTTFSMETLDNVQKIASAGIEIHPDGILIEFLKPNQKRKRRKVQYDKFKGKFPEGYEAKGVCEDWLRYIMGIEDVCEFNVRQDGDTLIIRDLECITYALLKYMQEEVKLNDCIYTIGVLKLS